MKSVVAEYMLEIFKQNTVITGDLENQVKMGVRQGEGRYYVTLQQQYRAALLISDWKARTQYIRYHDILFQITCKLTRNNGHSFSTLKQFIQNFFSSTSSGKQTKTTAVTQSLKANKLTFNSYRTVSYYDDMLGYKSFHN